MSTQTQLIITGVLILMALISYILLQKKIKKNLSDPEYQEKKEEFLREQKRKRQEDASLDDAMGFSEDDYKD